ncbi:ferredoxin [Actinoplanes sp. NPDC049802]|uniref:ferredoxin n=1 Tax=Actinoplanes sp. NPDC049802 TaxID=3154742 RepID=UPI0033D57ACA
MGSDESGDRPGWRVSVNQSRCIGSSMCESIAAGHFTVVGGVSRPRDEVMEPATEIQDAAGFCPVEAITLVDTATGAEITPAY